MNRRTHSSKAEQARRDAELFALFRKANDLWERGKLRQARAAFRRGALARDPSAELNYGYFLDEGLGGPRNKTYAMRWYERAYSDGVASAAGNIAILYREANKAPDAIEWFKKAISGGDVGASLELGKLYQGLSRPQAARACFQQVMRSRRAVASERHEARGLLRRLGRS